jgi:hypothetical protein
MQMVTDKVLGFERGVTEVENKVGEQLSTVKDKINAIGRTIEEDRLYQIQL